MRKIGFILILWWLGLSCEPAPTGELTLSEAALLRISPTAGAQVIDTLEAGLTVSLLKTSGAWAYVCYRGQRGWILTQGQALAEAPDLEVQPSDQSLLLARDDSVLVGIAIDGGEPQYARLSEFAPWVPRDSLAYAGFYEGLPGEEISLIIVNFAPRIALLVKLSTLDPETMEVREEQVILGAEVRREGNVALIESIEEVPFRRAEFVRMNGRYALLVEKAPHQYVILWRRAV
ncbi:MAG: SH3 domain-containing protein [Bacteroidia bacterium]|nr:SH3 domain-containing protein [Bacteroidia bacterium]GIV24253.1 MAG: hypothetical protein KatS3mg025_1912 [Bacteroidia bacterium]